MTNLGFEEYVEPLKVHLQNFQNVRGPPMLSVLGFGRRLRWIQPTRLDCVLYDGCGIRTVLKWIGGRQWGARAYGGGVLLHAADGGEQHPESYIHREIWKKYGSHRMGLRPVAAYAQ